MSLFRLQITKACHTSEYKVVEQTLACNNSVIKVLDKVYLSFHGDAKNNLIAKHLFVGSVWFLFLFLLEQEVLVGAEKLSIGPGLHHQSLYPRGEEKAESDEHKTGRKGA